MIKPTRIRWFSLERQCECEDILDQDEAISAAATLMRYGCPYVLLQDVVVQQMALDDAAEARLRAPITLSEHLQADYVAGVVEEALDATRKSSDT
jgi:hypothetical protein